MRPITVNRPLSAQDLYLGLVMTEKSWKRDAVRKYVNQTCRGIQLMYNIYIHLL